ncbi:hypothetical protein SNOG_12810 [Parastagonospora nodorum SN15]|uniref:Uncharacterized protein n=1 Tax=Phaeosphaeria nodorum (strain SN15 / ATCC MYA-4574 / FGSC 10173) TaxID=321614 RepID=Q0U604_PHANO|nr:hypothetical protein SNOG_12810 [Parastagonospora nodorum SN15]EAT79610.1 hypothetical protein SNOG_12810 [Parastagonospora nodorum SN15]
MASSHLKSKTNNVVASAAGGFSQQTSPPGYGVSQSGNRPAAYSSTPVIATTLERKLPPSGRPAIICRL